MKVIPREARRITYSSEIRNLKSLPFDKRQLAVIVGSILGDGCLMSNWSRTNYRLQIRHSVDKKDYLIWKKFYPKGKKMIPSDISELVQNPLTLAVWFMDDGNIVSKRKGYIHGYHLNTQSFTSLENQSLISSLKTIHGIECSVQKNNGYTRLFIRAQSRNRFVSLVKRYIIQSMKYKLG